MMLALIVFALVFYLAIRIIGEGAASELGGWAFTRNQNSERFTRIQRVVQIVLLAACGAAIVAGIAAWLL